MNLSYGLQKNSQSQFIQVKLKVVVFLILLLIQILFIVTPLQTAAAKPRQNNPPVAEIVAPRTGQTFAVNEVVHFDASNSSDPDNDALVYFWDFGDGSIGGGVTTSHKYSEPSVPVITLMVSDGELNDTDRVVIIIGTGGGMNRPPTATIISPNNFDTFTVSELIIFDGSNSSDPDDDPLSFQWDFGDNNISTNMIAVHSYAETGVYRVRLTVSDGMFNNSDRILIFVNNTPPVADAGGDKTGYLGQKLEFNGGNSSDPDRGGSIVNYTWNLGDGNIKTGEVIEHTYLDYDTYIVSLTVTDNNGAIGYDEIIVTITNSPPFAILKLGTTDTVINTDIEFDASSSYDIDGKVKEYFYNFGDGVETDWISLSKVEHKYRSLGQFTVTLLVSDNLNGISEPYYLNITITEKINQPPTVSITFPLNDDSVAGIVTINGQADDPDNRVEKVEVKIGEGGWVDATIVNFDGNTVDWEYIWDTEQLSDDYFIITARAYDGSKYSSDLAINVKVNNRPTTYIELSVDLKPEQAGPDAEVTVLGSAKYDTNVPVTNTNVNIRIEETKDTWTTITNDQGTFSKKIVSPSLAGRYTVSVYITDGTLENEVTERLTVLSQPDLYLLSDDIKFSPRTPKEKTSVEITATVQNSGELDASAKISFYLDTTDLSEQFESMDINVPSEGSLLVKATWRAQAGNHEIIIIISEVEPAEDDTSNNQASKSITVEGIKAEETDDKEQGSYFDTLTNLPPMIGYLIIGIIVIIIFVIIVAVALKTRKRKEPEELDERPSITSVTKQQKSSRPAVAALAIIFAIICIILMGAALFMPWYSMRAEATIGDAEEGIEFDIEQRYLLTEMEAIDHIGGESDSLTWEEAEDRGMNVGNTSNLYQNTQYLVITSLVMGILFIIGVVLAVAGKGKKVAIIFGLIALIICFTTPIYFMNQHPQAFNDDNEEAYIEAEKGPHKSFMGLIENEVPEADMVSKVTWGPANGWYLTIGGFVFALLGFIFSLALPKPGLAKQPETVTFIPTQKPTPTGMVVFKPLEQTDSEGSQTKTQVKFESL